MAGPPTTTSLIDEQARLLVQAVIEEAASRQFTNNSGRRAGRPPDVITPYLAPELLGAKGEDQALIRPSV